MRLQYHQGLSTAPTLGSAGHFGEVVECSRWGEEASFPTGNQSFEALLANILFFSQRQKSEFPRKPTCAVIFFLIINNDSTFCLILYS